MSDQPTPCANDGRWLSTAPEDIAYAMNGCLGCPALYQPHDTLGGTSCTKCRQELVDTDLHFPFFEGVIAGIVHNPRAERRAREKARREGAPILRDKLGRPRPTTCRRGHEFTEDNTYVDPKGARICRICRRANKSKFRAKAPKPERAPRKLAAACHVGHEFTHDNTYVTPDGKRKCRTCRRARQRAQYRNSKNQPTTRRDNAA